MGNFAGKKVLKYCHYFTKNFLGPMSELGGRGGGLDLSVPPAGVPL